MASISSSFPGRVVAAAPPRPPIRSRSTGAVSRAAIAILVGAAAIVTMAAGMFAQVDGGAARGTDVIATDVATRSSARADLVRHLERSPRDGRGFVLLARMDFESDRFADAAAAYERALASDAKVARDPAIWCEFADALGMAQGGSLAGKPRELVKRALAQDPAHPKALEMAGSAAFEAGEYQAAVNYWRQLLAQLPVDSIERRELAAAIARAEAFVPVTGALGGIASVAK